MNKPDQLPPYDAEAEAGALGCVLSANGDAGKLFSQLHLEHFYELRHQAVFKGLKSLASRGEGLDAVSLVRWLKENGELENAGGFEYAAALPDTIPSPEQFPVYLDTVQDRAERRADIRDSVEIEMLARNLAIPRGKLADAARRMLEARTRPPSDALPAISDAVDFTAEPLPQPPELVRGLIHKGSKLVLGGGSKSFKTWTLLDLALSVAHGREWLNFSTTRGRVLYLNFEIQAWSWQSRLQAVAKAKSITIEPGQLSLWNLRGKAAHFSDLLPKIRETIKQDFALIVLDPIYKIYGGTDENSAGDVARLLNGLEELAVSSGAAVAFGAHFSKGNQAGKESIDRISGSGVFARDPDSLLVFTRHEQADAFTVEATLRNFAPVSPFVVRWEFPLMTPAAELDPSRLKQVAGRKRESNPDELLDVLGDRILTSTEWAKEAENEAGIKNRTFYTLLKELQESDRVIRSRINNKWQRVSK
jgi:hypothetical protein